MELCLAEETYARAAMSCSLNLLCVLVRGDHLHYMCPCGRARGKDRLVRFVKSEDIQYKIFGSYLKPFQAIREILLAGDTNRSSAASFLASTESVAAFTAAAAVTPDFLF